MSWWQAQVEIHRIIKEHTIVQLCSRAQIVQRIAYIPYTIHTYIR